MSRNLSVADAYDPPGTPGSRLVAHDPFDEDVVGISPGANERGGDGESVVRALDVAHDPAERFRPAPVRPLGAEVGTADDDCAGVVEAGQRLDSTRGESVHRLGNDLDGVHRGGRS